MTTAFAYKDKDGIDINTIFSTERGAKVNWLWRFGIRVMESWTDTNINEVFEEMKPESGCIIAVNITEIT